jgi:hypothetical protein
MWGPLRSRCRALSKSKTQRSRTESCWLTWSQELAEVDPPQISGQVWSWARHHWTVKDCGQLKARVRNRRKHSHASELETLPGLKLAVAEGGIDCETVVLAVCAAATATRASVTDRVDSILIIARVLQGTLKLF